MKYVLDNMVSKVDYSQYDAIIIAEGVNDSIGFTSIPQFKKTTK